MTRAAQRAGSCPSLNGSMLTPSLRSAPATQESATTSANCDRLSRVIHVGILLDGSSCEVFIWVDPEERPTPEVDSSGLVDGHDTFLVVVGRDDIGVGDRDRLSAGGDDRADRLVEVELAERHAGVVLVEVVGLRRLDRDKTVHELLKLLCCVETMGGYDDDVDPVVPQTSSGHEVLLAVLDDAYRRVCGKLGSYDCQLAH